MYQVSYMKRGRTYSKHYRVELFARMAFDGLRDCEYAFLYLWERGRCIEIDHMEEVRR